MKFRFAICWHINGTHEIVFEDLQHASNFGVAIKRSFDRMRKNMKGVRFNDNMIIIINKTKPEVNNG